MGFLDKFLGLAKQKDEIIIKAPVEGEAVQLSEVSDPTFGEGILGQGMAICPTSGRIVSPVDGTVQLMFDTGHAVSILSDAGTEVLVHVGLDTVKLEGKHYTIHTKSGAAVKAGDLLMECDMKAIAADGYDTITPVIICNSTDYKTVECVAGKSVKELDNIITLAK
ncbi:MAG: PTS glucose transporter subunit IIA [Hydrogenoanaerobacterium sp.]